MSDPIPVERLQPCLLDRLTDDEPRNREESRAQRAVSYQRYRRGVLRDLEWLFGANAPLAAGLDDPARLANFPEAARSVLNFGTRQYCGTCGPNVGVLEEELREALRIFEPRLSSQSLTVHAEIDRNRVTFELNGQLWANPLPEQLFVKTTMDLETGQCLLGDAPHGRTPA